VHKENVEKAIDVYFSEIKVLIRTFPYLTVEEKDSEIKPGKLHLSSNKQAALTNNNIVIILLAMNVDIFVVHDRD
jgi:hypothetical protein